MGQQKSVEIAELAKHHGIQVKVDSLQFNDDGLDFNVVFAEDIDGANWILRIPRRDDVLPRTVTEQNALSLVREFVSFEIPNWEVFEKDLIAYQALSGVPAGKFTTEIQEYVWGNGQEEIPEQFHESLAKALAELHQLSKHRAKGAGLPVEEASDLKLIMNKRMHRIKEMIGVGESLWNRWQSWIANEEIWPNETGLIHGDLHPGHILVNKETMVTGLIDWTEARVADVANDFVYYYTAFGEKGLNSLIGYYHKADGKTWPLMKEHVLELAAAYFPIEIAEFAIASGTEEHEKLAKKLLGVSQSIDN
ncbi:macrolide 2'-phosphotransferase [Gracilibacillus alcaliphilus]|uniref:macrolide 2'-phosphotransferase n=1 Tax=Gracilibacillus alcaliphilus TaxID=1401441 RepID=UPI00195706AB|nr:macrolide 2'-phosphotransferase [Gracilibacillus alcaliphilus]MBM7678854.1 macrolide phosphotransferase [Gracilibacillus alcaliphilus]